MLKEYIDYINLALMIIAFVSYFIVNGLLGIVVFKYVAFISLIIMFSLYLVYYFRFKEIYFGGKACKGKKGLMIVIGYAIAIIWFCVLLVSNIKHS